MFIFDNFFRKMKNLIFAILSTTTLLFSCTPQNPNLNGNGGQTYNQGTPVTDVDGNIYPTIISTCGQTWTSKNLNVSHYRNGDIIPQVTDSIQWANLTTGAWCYYNNDAAIGTIYGKLYNWYAVNDPRSLAPIGWHVPSDYEWASLQGCLGGIANTAIAGGAMKEAGLMHWQSPNKDATNSSGFLGLPGGLRDFYGSFYGISDNGNWWSSTEEGTPFAYSRSLYYDYNTVGSYGKGKEEGISVRCVKD